MPTVFWLAVLTAGAAVVPMKVEIAEAASTLPPPWVRPRGVPFLRMMEVSASEPQPGVEQSRGVPSMMERPGMVTPLAP